MDNTVMKDFNFDGENYICKKCGRKIKKVLIASSVVEWELDGCKKINPVIKEQPKIILKCNCGNEENVYNMVLNHPDYLHFLKK